MQIYNVLPKISVINPGVVGTVVNFINDMVSIEVIITSITYSII